MASDHTFNTPPDLLAQVRTCHPTGQIGLDPCSGRYSMVEARTSYDIHSNGLVHPWWGHGLVFLNPPHSMSPMNIEPWMDKVRKDFLLRKVRDNDALVGLVPAKPDTEWFHRVIRYVDARCFLKGRIKFWQDGAPTAGAGKFPSMLFYIGHRIDLFDDAFKDSGWIV